MPGAPDLSTSPDLRAPALAALGGDPVELPTDAHDALPRAGISSPAAPEHADVPWPAADRRDGAPRTPGHPDDRERTLVAGYPAPAAPELRQYAAAGISPDALEGVEAAGGSPASSPASGLAAGAVGGAKSARPAPAVGGVTGPGPGSGTPAVDPMVAEHGGPTATPPPPDAEGAAPAPGGANKANRPDAATLSPRARASRNRGPEPQQTRAGPGLALGIDLEPPSPRARLAPPPRAALQPQPTPGDHTIELSRDAALLARTFDTQSLHSLARVADVDWEALGGATAGKAEMAERLIRALDSRGALGTFLAAARALRPEAFWRADTHPTEQASIAAPTGGLPRTREGEKLTALLVRGLSQERAEELARSVLGSRSLEWDDLGGATTGRAERLAHLVRFAETEGFLPELAAAAQRATGQAVGSAAPIRIPEQRPLPQGEPARVARMLGLHFSTEELRSLAAELFAGDGLTWDDFGGPGVGRAERAAQLVASADAEGRLDEVVAWARREAPEIWTSFDRDAGHPPELALPRELEVRREHEHIASRLATFDHEALQTLALDVFFDRFGLDFDDFGGPGSGRGARTERMVAFAQTKGLLGALIDRARQIQAAGLETVFEPAARPAAPPPEDPITEVHDLPADAPGSSRAVEADLAVAESRRPRAAPLPTRAEALIASGVPLMQAVASAGAPSADPVHPYVTRDVAAAASRPVVRRKKRPRRWHLL